MSKTKSRLSDAAVPVLAGVIAVGLTACGGTAVSPTGPSAPATSEAASTVVLSQTLADVQAGTERVISFNLARRGRLAITVEWSDDNNSVIASLTETSCLNFRTPNAICDVRRSSGRHRKDGREEGIDVDATEGGYLLTVRNLGPGAESIRVTGVLTSVSDAPAPVPPTPTPSSRPTERPDRNSPNPRQSGRP
jgi:hypothetical protein